MKQLKTTKQESREYKILHQLDCKLLSTNLAHIDAQIKSKYERRYAT